MNQHNKRIYVKNLLFEGWATVTYYFYGELLPYEITLDEGDEDGHKFFRVSKDDIVDMTSSSLLPEEEKIIEPEQLTLF
ncbi:hypothetical protein AJ85_05765 [Alkalihalobacillus alcalophilus ATCC 27647 = CGMCC 1.3604]|uniref:Uncharacterized protein n=1 Tax=Alkalihalobacillus alcalophilus ATCC 27647 = CGMCC 1.3604 TaxID=1218173 RepID=A0A094WGH9_ALKAL|nr:hypothetical protein [Alkalihalobacillus alcalophilus]YP_009276819.1 hypothetical protein BH791_gp13 [Bacillus phage BalMu-1]AJA42391.1 hypothetical protein BalMu1_B13 [Bacillus phage BalMu-1]AJA42447.1 hypothetical protein BalMu1_A13 [Bacillus phage BalMu-1]KGA96849.1 hypothetical protein BALCAV_0213585 [Alkalihalobacillus alcalophilus ATCC 27647 = CGMCC 1.3604]THG91330.1 hypothetical protein AJ85_05765 [Alkalihalobacillus alcalophilus ATCC 27647 = CGMCC 1.3604]